MWHKRIRQELEIADHDAKNLNELFRQGYQGSRFSFGYPACPNLEDQAKLFQAFAQVGASGRRRAEGTGLGLHLSQKLAELLAGEVTLQSEFGKGSRFTLVLREK